jgi:hypothetical protein
MVEGPVTVANDELKFNGQRSGAAPRGFAPTQPASALTAFEPTSHIVASTPQFGGEFE